ncbi:glycosyltransferase family 4 protein [Jiangella mangrovi]|uniref:Glycosyltransferase involved in cell wall biosynthesis n=1 Tax=Jiangella mangrovi TaxID=1524084 RepID=A0A7W9GLT8_9ACTN|nr:glycosyltransferase family 4 protein [Jiangella mangrovi]MBB5786228.1 glycosyltransferase involved in cell wall biosynthesis [Jiangella mangrovi]
MTHARTLGVTWGDPYAAFTYSGVPWHLFAELDRMSALSGRADANQTRLTDVLHGMVDVRRTLQARRPRRNALWRYLPANIERLSRRFAALTPQLPEHDAVLQFGVAGIPEGVPLVAHVEIPVEAAVSTPVFARSYGFDRFTDREIAAAIAGEREFLRACSVVWTNSPWTAAQLVSEDLPESRIRWYPPGCGMADPGEIERTWDHLSVLFIGKDWERKGGPELVEAFRQVRAADPEAELTVVGAEPDVDEPGVTVLGYLDKDVPADAARLDAAIRRATVFCLPSVWESTGIVYMEAALYGLPVVMLAGQGREALFPADGGVVLPDGDPGRLAATLLELGADPDRMRAQGAAGRAYVLEHYTWPTVAARVAGFVDEAVAAVA